MKRYLQFLIIPLAIILFCNITQVKADHLMGSDITWTCLGTDTYSVTVTIYRDCLGISMPANTISFSCEKAHSYAISVDGVAAKFIKDVTPVCKNSCTQCTKDHAMGNPKCKFPYGIEEYTFTVKIYLGKGAFSKYKGPACCNVNITWTSCCRSGTLTAGGNWQSFYVESSFDHCKKPCSSSPKFSNPPVAIICQNQCFSFNPGMIDQDGGADSFVYSIVKPMQDQTTPVTYNTGYSYKHPLKFGGFPNDTAQWNPPKCNGFHLDSATGDLQFMPTKVEQTVFAFQVQIYGRDATGKVYLKGTTRRDMQIIVMACPSNHIPTLTGINGTNSNDIDICANQLTCFTINSNDIDPKDTVTVDWNAALTSLGATFTVPKGYKHPTATFCWKPTNAMVRNYPYQFIARAADDACPVNGRTQRSFRIKVHAAPEATVTAVDSGCGNWWFTLTLKPGTTWDGTIKWGGDDYLNGNKLQIFHHYQHSGDSMQYSATIKAVFSSAAGIAICPTVISGKIWIPPYVDVQLPRDSFICKGDTTTVSLTALASQGTPPYTYQWYTKSGTKIANTTRFLVAKVVKDTGFYVVVQDNNGTGCTNADTLNYKAIKPKKPVIIPGGRHCAGETVILRDTAEHDSVGYYWTNTLYPKFKISDSSTAIVKDSGTYKLRINDARISTCYNFDSLTVYFNKPVTVKPQTVQGCSGIPVRIDPSGGNGDSGALWEWRDLYNQSTVLFTGMKQTITPTKDMHFFVTSLQSRGGITCGDSDTINILINPLPPNKILPVPAQCYSNPPVDLSSYTSTPGGIWSADTINSPKKIVQNGHFYPDSVPKTNRGYAIMYIIKDPTTGCINIKATKIEVDSTPLMALKKDSFQCIDATQPFDLNSLIIAPVGGTWSGPAVANNRFFYQNDPQAGGAGKKTFIYSYTDKYKTSHCSNTDTVHINVYSVLQPKGGYYPPTCKNSAAPILLNGNIDTTYDPAWSFPGGTLDKIGNWQYVFDPAKNDTGTHILIFSASYNGHCPRYDTVKITVNPNPIVKIAPMPNICITGGAVKLSGSPNGFISAFEMVGQANPSAIANKNNFDPMMTGVGTFKVRYKYQDSKECWNADTTTIIVEDTPGVQILSRNPQACVGVTSLKLQALFDGKIATGVTWSSHPYITRQTATNGDTENVYFSPGSVNSFWAIATQSVKTNSCPIIIDSVPVNLNPNPIPAISGLVEGCSPLTVNFRDASKVQDGAIASWNWNFGDGTSSSSQNPLYTYTKDTTADFPVTITVISDKQCKSVSIPEYVHVYARPQPWFDISPLDATIALPQITFHDLTPGNTPYMRGDWIHKWNFGDGGSSNSNAEFLSHTYSDTGIFTVRLTVQNPKYNCEADTTREVNIRPELIVYIPNAFSPNHLFNAKTLINEKFSPVVSNFLSYHLLVYSRWGELMYETTDVKQGWDGTYLGKDCEEGVYIYKVDAVSMGGKTYKYSGSITLLR